MSGREVPNLSRVPEAERLSPRDRLSQAPLCSTESAQTHYPPRRKGSAGLTDHQVIMEIGSLGVSEQHCFISKRKMHASSDVSACGEGWFSTIIRSMVLLCMGSSSVPALRLRTNGSIGQWCMVRYMMKGRDDYWMMDLDREG